MGLLRGSHLHLPSWVLKMGTCHYKDVTIFDKHLLIKNKNTCMLYGSTGKSKASTGGARGKQPDGEGGGHLGSKSRPTILKEVQYYSVKCNIIK